ncbi:MAG TPA: helix-turn-helix domain-containing protein [Steroidobacteraceae bacterium]|nr:helix-turn-helix domain-containing protein [Steroidobacteraceae bacterium]
MNTVGRTIDVWVVIPERLLLLDIAGPMEVLRRANAEQDDIVFRIHYAGASAQTMSSIGIRLADIAALPATLPKEAMIIVPGSADGIAFAQDPGDAAVRADETAIVEWLRASVLPGHILMTICSGALLAARAGLLDGHSCTTHHAECAELAALAPLAKVLDNRLFVIDRDRYTSAGVTAGLDLMLHVVSTLAGHACALAIARHLVLYLRREGADPQISPWLAGRNHLHPAVHRAQDAIIADPAADWTLPRVAQIANSSARHLSRLFNQHAGMSLTVYINNLRVSLALQLLKSSRLDMERVAERTGFASSRQLRRAWRRVYDTPPGALRSQEPAGLALYSAAGPVPRVLLQEHKL